MSWYLSLTQLETLPVQRVTDVVTEFVRNVPLWRMERCVCSCSSWLRTSSSTDDTLSSVQAYLGLPLPFFRSVVPVFRIFFRRFSNPRLFLFFLWELTHQFCRPIVFQQIQFFMSTLSSSLNTIFDGFNSFFYNLFTYVVCYLQRIFNQNPKLKQ